MIKGEGKSKKEKLEKAKKLLERPSIKTVVEKVGNVRGRLRTIDAKHVFGEKTLIADYKENGCDFRFNVATCYFSSRLSGERKLIAEKIKMKDNVLVMFAGVGVFPIVIYKYSKPARIVGVEIGKDCCNYFKENLKLNKIPAGRVEVVQGDVKKKVDGSEKFDVVIMARPNLDMSFLEWGLKASKKGTKLFYHAFSNVDGIDEVVRELVDEGSELGRKLKVVEVVRAGDIAPYKFRYRVEFKLMD